MAGYGAKASSREPAYRVGFPSRADHGESRDQAVSTATVAVPLDDGAPVVVQHLARHAAGPRVFVAAISESSRSSVKNST